MSECNINGINIPLLAATSVTVHQLWFLYSV